MIVNMNQVIKGDAKKTSTFRKLRSWHLSDGIPITSCQIDGETVETVADFIFLDSKITADGDCSHEIKRRLFLGRKLNNQPRQHIKNQRHHFVNKGPSSQGYGFSCGHVWM